MEHAGLIELLATAAARTPTVTATVRRWSDEARTAELLRALALAEDVVVDGAPRDVRGRTRLWVRRPDRLRWESEHEIDGIAVGVTVGVKAGERYWLRHGFDDRIDSNEDHPGGGWTWTDEELVVEPAPLLGQLLLDVEGETVAHGRAAVRVRGRARPLTPGGMGLLAPVADECELLVDTETGLLLYLGVRADGATVRALETVQLAVGEPLADELFEPLV